MIVRTRQNIAAKPISVCFLIGGLEFGGAERQVIELTRSFDASRVKASICSLSRRVPLLDSLPESLVPVHFVEKKSRFDFTAVYRAARFLRERRFDVVHGFSLDAEIVARLAAPLARVPVVVASERNANYRRSVLHHFALKATQPLFDVLVANSVAGQQFSMQTLGLTEQRVKMVRNGIDCQTFRPDRESGRRFRHEVGIADSVPLVGMVGSYKRQKAQDLFLRMARVVSDRQPEAEFLLVGELVRDRPETSGRFRDEVRALASELGISARCHFVGNQLNMAGVYNACDVTALLSRREGTPNVVLESMACGVPPVVTDISDNRHIVADGESGFVVRAGDWMSAADRTLELLSSPLLRTTVAHRARELAQQQFSLQTAVDRLSNIYHECLRRKSRYHQ